MLHFVLHSQNGDVSLPRSCVESNDDVPPQTLLKHLLLVFSGFKGLNGHLISLCWEYIVWHNNLRVLLKGQLWDGWG
jgi:hypothetical protein